MCLGKMRVVAPGLQINQSQSYETLVMGSVSPDTRDRLGLLDINMRLKLPLVAIGEREFRTVC